LANSKHKIEFETIKSDCQHLSFFGVDK